MDYRLIYPGGEPVSEQAISDMHDEMLNEIYPEVSVGIYRWEPARVLRVMDPIAYQISVIEFVDQMVEQGAFIEVEKV